jgi:putative acetyltransferase
VFLRRERLDDRAAIFTIHVAAFTRGDGLVAPEARLVNGLREDGDIVPACSIVAESTNELVGQVVCSRATIDS